MTPTELVLSRLSGVRRRGDQWKAICPAHEDDTASLSIREGDDGRCLLKCFAGCPVAAIVGVLGLRDRDLFPPREQREARLKSTKRGRVVATYDYTDESGELLYQVRRFHPKTFRPLRLDGMETLEGVRRVLYRLPAVVAAVAARERVWVVEGEKDADNLAALGLCATTKQGGADGPWEAGYTESLRGANVVLLPDNDDSGRRCMQRTAVELKAVGCQVREVLLPGLPPKGDTSDWLEAGGTREELERLAEAEPEAKVTPGRTLLRSSDRNFEIEKIRKIDTDPPIYYVTVFGQEVKMSVEELSSFQRFGMVAMGKTNRVADLRNPNVNWKPYLDECMVTVLEVEAAPAEASMSEVLWHHVSSYLNTKKTEEEEDLAELRGVYSNERFLYFHGPSLHRYLTSRNIRVDQEDLWDLLRQRGAEAGRRWLRDSAGVNQLRRTWRVEKRQAEDYGGSDEGLEYEEGTPDVS